MNTPILPTPTAGPARRRLVVAAVAALIAACVVALPAALTGCDSGDPEPSPSPSGTIAFSNDDLGFSISRDAAFEKEYYYEAPLARFKIGFLDVDSSSSQTSPDELLVTGIGEQATEDLATPAGRQKVLDEIVAEMIAAGQGKKSTWTRSMINGFPAAIYAGRDKESRVQRVTCIIVGARDIYVLTGEAADSSWDEKLPLFGQAFDSFREL